MHLNPPTHLDQNSEMQISWEKCTFRFKYLSTSRLAANIASLPGKFCNRPLTEILT